MRIREGEGEGGRETVPVGVGVYERERALQKNKPRSARAGYFAFFRSKK